MAVNKVVFGNTTVMDITDSTVTASKLKSGETAYAANGAKITGELVVPEILNDLSDVTINTPANAHEIYYDGSQWINYGAKILLTFDDAFQGQTITLSKGQTVITKVAPLTGNSMSLYISETGEWTISSTIDQETYETVVTITAFGITYTAELVIGETTPQGSTVTPTDDIQIWLACANLDKPYTTLEAVLADRETFETLIADSNACDYMARSTTWAGSSEGLVPNMTSATTPSGEVYTNSALNATYAGWKAFNGVLGVANDSNRWVSVGGQSGTNAFLMYDFIDAVAVNMIKIYAVLGNNSYEHPVSATIYIEGSTDNGTWEPITSKELTTTEMSQYTDIIFENNTAYRSYRLYFNRTNIYGTVSDYYSQIRSVQFYRTGIVTDSDVMSLIGKYDYCSNALLSNATWASAIANSDYFESILNAKVPVMTSNTTPSGVASASSVYNNLATYQAWKAFNGTNADSADTWASASNSFANSYLQYQFAEPKVISMIRWENRNNTTPATICSPKTYKIQGYNGSEWVDLTEELTNSDNTSSAKHTVFVTKNKGSYQYYRMFIIDAWISGGDTYCCVAEFQLYGRASSEVIVPLVPTMTSDTTPSGECMSSDMSSPYMAFDGNDSTFSNTNSGVYTGSIIYDFQKQVVVNASYIDGNWSTGYNIYGSTNNTDWIELGVNLNPSSIVSFNNTNEYRYYKITVLGTISAYVRIYTAQLYQKTVQTNIVHSCANDTIYYMDEGSPVIVATTNSDGDGVLDFSSLEDTEYTFYSSVAKDPSNLSNDYSKTIRITKSEYGGTTEMYLMPDTVKTPYWFGYESDNLEDCTSANGWSVSGFTLVAPTHNTTNISLSSASGQLKGVGTKSKVNLNSVKAIATGTTAVSGVFGVEAIATAKNISSLTKYVYYETSSISLVQLDADTSGEYNATFYATAGRNNTLHALWYE